jgi:oligopeptidase A
MENFVWRAEVLPLISAHVTTGEPLPADMLKRLLGTRTFNAALDTCGKSSSRASISSCTRTSTRPLGAQGRRDSRERAAAGGGRAGGAVQSHAGELLAHLCRRLRGGLLQLQVGRGARRRRLRGVRAGRRVRQRHGARFLDSILARGGSLDAMDAFVRFRGRQPDVRPLLKQTGIAA